MELHPKILEKNGKKEWGRGEFPRPAGFVMFPRSGERARRLWK